MSGKDVDAASPGPVPGAPESDVPVIGHGDSRRRLPHLPPMLAQQWAEARAGRRVQPGINAGESNFRRAEVPYGVDLAAAWGWRFLIIVASGLVILWTLKFFIVVTLPLVIALFFAALTIPVVDALQRVRLPRGLAAMLVLLGSLIVVGGLLTFAGQQVATGAQDLGTQTVEGLTQIRDWLQNGPLGLSDKQLDEGFTSAQDSITAWTGDGHLLSHVSEVTTTLGHILAGFFIIVFATYFFLADGERIWAWFVRLTPRAARTRTDSSGRVAWISLTKFVRATVIVAATDAMGVMLAAGILGVPLVAAIGVLVFLGAFVPMVGATVAGTVAVLVALVAKGPLIAVFMAVGVIIVQQIEGHVLQPFLMGRWVSVHPLGVIVAIGCGILVAGIAGALIAVPVAAALNSVVQHLAEFTDIGDDAEEALDEDRESLGNGEKDPGLRGVDA